jgi:hypothetical protein
VGRLKTGQRITFDRGSLVIAPENLARGKASGIADGEMNVYFADDENAGLTRAISYKREYSASASQSIKLTEKSSKTTYDNTKTSDCGPGRVRDIQRTEYKKTYEVQFSDDGEAQTIELNCYEYTVSACG